MRDTKDIYQVIGKNIRKYRQLARFSQETLAFTSTVNRSFLGDLERSVKKPSIDTMLKIANTLKVPLFKFFVIEEDEI